MPKVDFTKTPAQVRKEIETGLEELNRDLNTSKGNKEKGTSALLNIVTILLVLLGNSVFAFVTDLKPAKSTSNQLVLQNLSGRDIKIIEGMLSMIEESTANIDTIRNRVAPSMPIDGQVAAIKSTTKNIRSILFDTDPEKQQTVTQK